MDPTTSDPGLSARETSLLRYVTDESPGIRRLRRDAHFSHADHNGKPIRDTTTLARIASLAISPAYESVWILPVCKWTHSSNGARGRKQYCYHTRRCEIRDETKCAHMLEFAAVLPKMRKRVDSDLRKPNMPREKLLAAVVKLLETTTIRIGNDEYAKENKSFGLTTLRNSHARVAGDRIRFSIRGMSGIKHVIDLHDRRLARIVRAAQESPGQQRFEYCDDDGAVHRAAISRQRIIARGLGRFSAR